MTSRMGDSSDKTQAAVSEPLLGTFDWQFHKPNIQIHYDEWLKTLKVISKQTKG